MRPQSRPSTSLAKEAEAKPMSSDEARTTDRERRIAGNLVRSGPMPRLGARGRVKRADCRARATGKQGIPAPAVALMDDRDATHRSAFADRDEVTSSAQEIGCSRRVRWDNIPAGPCPRPGKECIDMRALRAF